VPYERMGSVLDFGAEFDESQPLEVEIGFGQGEVLVRKALEHPQRNFVGIERHWQRIFRTMKTITRFQSRHSRALRNVRILDVDAVFALEYLFAKESIDHLYALFPCPWPKEKHARHRLFSTAFLKFLNSRLKAGAQVQIVTDLQPYQQWILQQIPETGFVSQTQEIHPRFETKFERKWRLKGQETFFEICLRKISSIDVPEKEFIDVKSYRLENFDPGRFAFEDCKGPVSVIFKDFMFDPQRQRAEVYVLVAEGHLTQHLRVWIFRKDNFWRLCKAEGQMFFPTPGIAQAIDLVYEAAVKTTQN
jgi:tRNA (guanine-N7-)-methyltransferase